MRIPTYQDVLKFAKEFDLTERAVYDQYRLGYCKFPRTEQPTADLGTEFQNLKRICTLWTDDKKEFVEQVFVKCGPRPGDSYDLVLIDSRKPATLDNLKWAHFYQTSGTRTGRKAAPRTWTQKDIMQDLTDIIYTYGRL